MTNEHTSVNETYSPSSATFGVAVLALFAFFRPVTVSFHHIGSVSVLDIFGIASSYLILLALLINMRNIRLPGISYFILFYVFYCSLSIFWGSGYRDVVRAVAPFLPFFLVMAAVRHQGQVKFLLSALCLGYLLPVFGSIYLNLAGKSDIIVTGSMLERQAGLSSGVHTTGHLMLFFSFVFALYHIVNKDNGKLRHLLLAALLAGSVFCMYKTYTRTVFMGGLIFWSSYLFFTSKKWFFAFVMTVALISLVKFSDINSIVMQKQQKNRTFDVNAAGSGRESLWKHNLQLYAALPVTSQLLGVGMGKETQRVPGSFVLWAGSHNDYISLMVTVGAMGLLLYLVIYGIYLLAIVRSRWRRDLSYFALSLMLSVILMNFVSNSYIVRFQMAQLLWFILGLIYAYGIYETSVIPKPEKRDAQAMPALIGAHGK